MTLQEFFVALKKNTNALVTINELDSEQTSTQLTQVVASGYAQLLTALLAREIDTVEVRDAKNIIVTLTAGA